MFNAKADAADKFGSFGGLVGHELTRAIDAKGALVDAKGELRSWWTPADKTAWTLLGNRVAAQYSAYDFPGVKGAKVNGTLTQEENLADIAGLELAWAAYTAQEPKAKPAQQQGFFRAWSALGTAAVAERGRAPPDRRHPRAGPVAQQRHANPGIRCHLQLQGRPADAAQRSRPDQGLALSHAHYPYRRLRAPLRCSTIPLTPRVLSLRLRPSRSPDMAHKNTICLWYDNGALEAATYASILPDSAVIAVHHAPGDFPDGKEGNVLTVEFTVCGIPCVGLNGGTAFKHSEAFSFQIQTEDQAETDRLWDAIVGNGGQESQCGWCKDRWGISWQISPRMLIEAVTSKDKALAKRLQRDDADEEDRHRHHRSGIRDGGIKSFLPMPRVQMQIAT